jgi:RimJ/RimL family protein N-acetyltransferase
MGTTSFAPILLGVSRRPHACYRRLRSEAQGQGVGRALTTALLALADDYLGLERVALDVYVDNARARALYERLGFALEGTQRMAAFRRGTYVDSFRMSRARPRVAASAATVR